MSHDDIQRTAPSEELAINCTTRSAMVAAEARRTIRGKQDFWEDFFSL